MSEESFEPARLGPLFTVSHLICIKKEKISIQISLSFLVGAEIEEHAGKNEHV